jgi:hypothetical protein
MSLTYRDQVYLVPPARRSNARDSAENLDHGIGRSPRFAPGWWLTGVAVFYAAVALLCIFAL